MKIFVSPADEKLAAAFFQRQGPVEVVKHGILLGCTRRYMTLLTTPNSGAIVNPSYFQNAIEEATASKLSNGYWLCLRRRVDEVEKEWVQKTGLSH